MAQKKKAGPAKKTGKRKKKKTASRKLWRNLLLTAVLLAVSATLIIYLMRNTGTVSSLFPQSAIETFTQIEDALNSLESKEWKAELYFGDESSDFLIAEYRRVRSADAPDKKAAALVNELILGPAARGVRTIPEQTVLRGVTLDRHGTARVDFSPELIELHPGGSSSEIMTVFSIVQTLTANILQVRKVKIIVDGRDVETIAGHIDCSNPFDPNDKIIR